jgi:hypothetical protein
MNERDTAQKIFVLNWDLRQSAQTVALPLEPAATSAIAQAPGAAVAAAEAKEEGEC